MTQNSAPQRRLAFTLIELLVIIAIVMLLISLLLPALRKARIEAWKTVSMSNLRQICIAGATYQNDNKGNPPLTPPRSYSGQAFGIAKGSGYPLWCTWSSFGKNCDFSWFERSPRAIGWFHNGMSADFFYSLDMPAQHRPLNHYLYSESIPGNRSSLERGMFTLPVCQDPSDKIGHQQNYGQGGDVALQKHPAIENDAPAVSSYSDVGTSYQWTELWARQVKNAIETAYSARNDPQLAIDGSAKLFGTGNMLFRTVAKPSDMIWINDEYAKVVMRAQDINIRFRNGYGDINKGVVGYLDGHVRYIPITPLGPFDSAKWLNDPMSIPAFRNEYYTAGFDRRDLPKSP